MSTHPVVVPIEIRERFETYRGIGAYERWFRRFKRVYNSFTDIATEEGLSRERISQIYENYFAPFLPQKNGKERLHACALHRAKLNFERTQRQIPPRLKEIAREAKSHKFTVYSVPCKMYASHASRKSLCDELIINEKRCKIHRITGGKSPHANAVATSVWHPTLGYYDIYIFYVDIEGFQKTFFIVPKEIIRDANLCVSKIGRVIFSLPLTERLGGVGNRTKVNWREFRGAWHLLKTGEEE